MSDKTENDKLKSDLLVAQYTQAAYDRRYYDQAAWQIPSIALTVISVVIVVAFNFVHIAFISGVFLLFGALFNFALLIVFAKHRLTIDARTKFLSDIEKKYELNFFPWATHTRKDNEGKTVPGMNDYLGEDYGHVVPWFFRNRRAFNWIFYSLLILSVMLILLGVYMLTIFP